MSDPDRLIEADVAARVLSRALAHGGDFAEVFAERTAGLTMAIDESRERPTSLTSTASTPPISSTPPPKRRLRCAKRRRPQGNWGR